MLILFRRLGILVPVLLIGCILATSYIVGLVMDDPDYAKWSYWPKALGAVIAALVLWAVGKWLNRRSLLTLFRESTSLEVEEPHSLFGIDFEYWGFLPLTFSVVGYFV